MSQDRSQDIRDRAFRYGAGVARLALTLQAMPGARSIADQLLKSGTAVGANLEEAKAGSTKREFIRLIEIALREARESVYWLRMCDELSLSSRSDIEALRDEGDQIARILGAIVVKAKMNQPRR